MSFAFALNCKNNSSCIVKQEMYCQLINNLRKCEVYRGAPTRACARGTEPHTLMVIISDVIQLTLTLKMTTAQVVKTSVIVNNNSPLQAYVHPDDETQPTSEMTPGFRPFILSQVIIWSTSFRLVVTSLTERTYVRTRLQIVRVG